ncbi:MAG: serine hydrolase domain-containing protein [Thermodesulfobacteriota bacterium]
MKTTDPTSVGVSAERLARLDQWLEKQISNERLAGCSLLFGRRGQAVYFKAIGKAELEPEKPFKEDTIVRIFSMTKPITTVAAMMLYEENHFQLDDPLSQYIPAFRNMRVWQGQRIDNTQPAEQPITIRQLMTHTSGLTYGFMQANPVDARYRELKIERPSDATDLEEWVNRLATIPLICQPGSQWNYSVSTDVLGRLVEIWSGESLAEFFENRILKPLKMVDTGFQVAEGKQERFAALYTPVWGASLSDVGRTTAAEPKEKRGGLKLEEAAGKSSYLKPTNLYMGGGGLTSTISDFAKFCQMLLNRGELEGKRLLGRKMVEYMMTNHLPDHKDMAAMGQPVWSETTYEGIGFGLGGAVVLDPVKAQIVTSVGEYHWGGAASTFFWLDPVEDLYVVFLTQLVPSSSYPLRRELRTRVYQTLT